MGSRAFSKLLGRGQWKALLAGSQGARFRSSTSTASYEFETLLVTSPGDHVLVVELHRPEVHNALNQELGRELKECFKRIHDDRHCRAVVVAGAGRDFSAGLDFVDLNRLIEKVSKPADTDADVLLQSNDVGRKAKFINGLITSFQETFSSIESCAKPVIASISGNCIGAAFSLLASCDVRYASADTTFQMKEMDIGMTADMGSLQRIPKSIGNNSLFRELMFSARKFSSAEAEKMGFISQTLADPETTKSAAIELAVLISQKSPIAVQGAKVCARYSRDHTVYDGLRFMANWNMTMYQSEDLIKGASAVATKSRKTPTFSDL